MSERQIKEFLKRLEHAQGSTKDALKGLMRRHEAHVNIYAENSAFPGEDYLFVGESSNLERRLLGTEDDARRKHVIAMIFRSRGLRCIQISDALELVEDFDCILNRFEYDLLKQLPDGAVGPAFDEQGNEIAGAFTVWRRASQAPKETRVRELVSVGR